MKRLIAVLAVSLAAGAANAANVALFADTTYVDYNVGNSSSEASNMQAALASVGNAVTPFVGTDVGSWTTALAGKQVLVIPEQEKGPSLGGALPPATITAIDTFVTGGGTLIVAEDYRTPSFVNAVFGFSVVEAGGGVGTLNAANAAGTRFAGGPPTLPVNNATNSNVTASLPAGAKCIYDAGANCTVWQVAHGAGLIVYLAWDFYNQAPVGTQDGGWNNVLFAAAGPTVQAVVPTLGEYALAALALVLAAAGGLMLRRRPTLG
jgi:hypothetical protein